jgi:tripartite-type tricarboxylate transporter receptor subunit TctC
MPSWRFCFYSRPRRQRPRKIGCEKSCELLCHFGAGLTSDIVAHLVAEGLQHKYPTTTFVVENKPGASGNLGTDAFAKAAPDGSTIGVSIGGPLAINTLVRETSLRSSERYLADHPAGHTASVLAVKPDLGVNSVAELVSPPKKNPGKYNFASIGTGSLCHLAMEAIAIATGQGRRG